jgi:hypothetical protein
MESIVSQYSTVEFWNSVHVAIVATLILSSIWLVIKTQGPKLLKILLSIFTLGSEKIKSGIYQRISFRNHSARVEFLTIILLYIVLLSGGIFIPFATKILNISDVNKVLYELEIQEDEFWSIASSETKCNCSEIELLDRIEENKENVFLIIQEIKKVALVLQIMASLGMMIVLFKFTILTYVSAAQSYFQKLMDLSGPFLRPIESRRFYANFAKIRNRADYVNIISSLESVLEKNNEKIPRFQTW